MGALYRSLSLMTSSSPKWCGDANMRHRHPLPYISQHAHATGISIPLTVEDLDYMGRKVFDGSRI